MAPADAPSEPFASLVREHERIGEVVTAAREAAEAAVQYPDEPELVPEALGELRRLEMFMSRELALHIAKEEQVLFPAYRELSGDDRLIDELVVQHGRVRERRELLARALRSLDHDHHEVEAEQRRLADGLRSAEAAAPSSSPPPGVIADLADGVRRLDWIFQGHFGDEEDDLFEPGETLFTREALADLHRQMLDLEASRDWSAPAG